MNKRSHLKRNKGKFLRTISGSKSMWAAGGFSSNSFIFLHEENRKHRPLTFCFSIQTELECNWYSYEQVTVFEVWNVIPGKQDLEKREVSYAAGGKPHPKTKAKIQTGFNYDTMGLYGVWTKSLNIARNIWKQIWYLRCESKDFLSDLQLICTNSFRILHVSFWIIALSGCLATSGIAGSYGNSSFSLFEELPYCSLQWLHQFTFPATVSEGFLFSTPSATLMIWRLFNDGPSDQFESVPQCRFDLHFSNNKQEEHHRMILYFSDV